MDLKDSPDLTQLARDFVYTYGGIAALIIFTIFAALVVLFQKEIREFIIRLFKRWRIPNADNKRYSILVFCLEDDIEQAQEKMLIEALLNLDGIQILRTNFPIAVNGPNPEEQIKKGHKRARAYLKKSNASLAVWGKSNSRLTSQLYMTLNDSSIDQNKYYRGATIEHSIALPEMFWTNLS